MNQVKKVMVVMLPTENINKNGIQPFKGKHGLMVPCTGAQARKWSNLECHTMEAQHLYFCINEELKEDDWIYSELSNPHTPAHCIQKNFVSNFGNGNEYILYSDAQTCMNYKIIASTDETLELPRPSKAFIQKYCEYGPFDKVNVEYEENCNGVYLPKRAKDNTITVHPLQYLFTRKEVTALVSKVLYDANNVDYPKMDLREKAIYLNEWLDNNLN